VGTLAAACPAIAMENHDSGHQEPADELISLLMEIKPWRQVRSRNLARGSAFTSGTRQAPPSGRLRPLLVGRPHPRRLLPRWAGSGVVKVVNSRWFDPLLTR